MSETEDFDPVDTGEHLLQGLPDSFKLKFPGLAAALGAHPSALMSSPSKFLSPAYGELFGMFTAWADVALFKAFGLGRENTLPEKGSGDFFHSLEKATIRPKELVDGDEEALSLFVKGALAAADLVRECGSISPVSGSENLFADTWQMAGARDSNGAKVPRGHLVGLGSLCAMVFYGKLFEKPFSRDDAILAIASAPTWEETETALRSFFPEGAHLDRALRESRAKFLSGVELGETLSRLSDSWEAARIACDAILMRPERASAMLRAANCRPSPQELGMSPARTAVSAVVAHALSRNLTVLDAAFLTGRFDECVSAVAEAFAPPPEGESV